MSNDTNHAVDAFQSAWVELVPSWTEQEVDAVALALITTQLDDNASDKDFTIDSTMLFALLATKALQALGREGVVEAAEINPNDLVGDLIDAFPSVFLDLFELRALIEKAVQ